MGLLLAGKLSTGELGAVVMEEKLSSFVPRRLYAATQDVGMVLP
jgi:hypothetical protein